MRFLHGLLEHHCRVVSPIHRLSAGFKLSAALLAAITALAAPLPRAWPVLAGLCAVLLLTAWLGRLPWGFLAGRLLCLEPFVLGVAVLRLWGPHGISAFFAILCKSTLCLLAMILLAATTTFSDMLAVLSRAGLPSLLVTVLALMYRYLFVLIDESERMARARTSRSFAAGRAWAWRSSAAVAGGLFLRSSSRAQRVYDAMCARGWR